MCNAMIEALSGKAKEPTVVEKIVEPTSGNEGDEASGSGKGTAQQKQAEDARLRGGKRTKGLHSTISTSRLGSTGSAAVRGIALGG